MQLRSNTHHVIAYPIVLALLVTAGQFKAHPLLSWIPIDLTLFLALLVFILLPFARISLGAARLNAALPVILWIAFLPSVAISIFDDYSVRKIALLFSVSFVLALSPFYALRTVKQRNAFLIATAAISIVFILGILSQGSEVFSGSRVVAENANTFGTARVIMAGAIVLALQAFNSSKSNFYRTIVLLCSLGASLLGIMTGSRGPIFASAFAVLLVVVLTPVFQKYRFRAVFGTVSLVVFLYWLASRNGSDGFSRIVAGSETSDGARKQMWEQALQLLSNHPFGIGWGMFDPPGPELHGYPHNFLLEIGVEGGWIPLILTAALLLATLVKGVWTSRDLQSSTFLALYIFALVNAMVSGDLNGNRLLWVTAFAIWAFASNVPRSRSSIQISRQNPLLRGYPR